MANIYFIRRRLFFNGRGGGPLLQTYCAIDIVAAVFGSGGFAMDHVEASQQGKGRRGGGNRIQGDGGISHVGFVLLLLLLLRGKETIMVDHW